MLCRHGKSEPDTAVDAQTTHHYRYQRRLIDQTVGKVFALLGLDHNLYQLWGGGKNS